MSKYLFVRQDNDDLTHEEIHDTYTGAKVAAASMWNHLTHFEKTRVSEYFIMECESEDHARDWNGAVLVELISVHGTMMWRKYYRNGNGETFPVDDMF